MKRCYYFFLLTVITFFHVFSMQSTYLKEIPYSFLDKLDGYGNREIKIDIGQPASLKTIGVVIKKDMLEINCFSYHHTIVQKIAKRFKNYALQFCGTSHATLLCIAIYSPLFSTDYKEILQYLFMQEESVGEEIKELLCTKVTKLLHEHNPK